MQRGESRELAVRQARQQGRFVEQRPDGAGFARTVGKGNQAQAGDLVRSQLAGQRVASMPGTHLLDTASHGPVRRFRGPDVQGGGIGHRRGNTLGAC